MKKILCVIAVTLMGMATIFAQTPNYQGIIYVTPTGAGTHSGDSWANATSSIADAQTLARANNAVVWVAAGIYYGDTSAASKCAFNAVQKVDVYGGFAGNEPDNYDLSLRDFVANETILDGDSARPVLGPSESNHYYPSIWDGFTIQNGYCYGFNVGAAGVHIDNGVIRHCNIHNNNNNTVNPGGVYAVNATIINCKIYDNTSVNGSGGGLSCYHSNIMDCEIYGNKSKYYGQGGGISGSFLSISNCKIYNNTAGRGGGGVWIRSSNIDSCLIYNNSSDDEDGFTASSGGGMSLINSTASNCIVHNNMSDGFGGGIAMRVSNLINCTIMNNTANRGGGVYLEDSSSVYVCKIYSNSTNYETSDGGGIYADNVNDIVISNCVISKNTTNGHGGGLFLLSGTHISVSNSLISNNNNGVYVDHGTISNSTIVRNSGMMNYVDSLVNCIVWGNEIIEGYWLYTASSAYDGQYYNMGNHIDISGQQIFVNPSLTVGAGDSTGNVDWHLLPNAVCINQGNNSYVTDSTDLDGLPRIGCNIVDMGCYEFYRVNHVYQTVPTSYTWHGNTYTESGDYPWLGLLSTYCDSLEVLHLTVGNVGVDNPSTIQEETMRLYPNPTTGIVNVQLTMNNEHLGNAKIQVFDIYGKLVDVVETCHGASLQTGTGTSVQTQIDLSRYANGVYFIKAVADGNVIGVRKVVKQ